MANYPDVPDYRLPYDAEGCILFYHGDGSPNVTQYTGNEMQLLNDESTSVAISPGDGSYFSQHWQGLIFPYLVNVTAFFIVHGNGTGAGSYNGPIYTSTNTTNGVDGVWTQQDSSWPIFALTSYRSSIVTSGYGLPWNGIRSVKFMRSVNGTSNSWEVLHLYGTIVTGEAVDRLILVDPNTLAEVSPNYFNWGDIPRGAVDTRTFRIKNNSSTKTASGISVACEALTDTTPTNVSAHTFSYNGGAYASSINVPGSLTPGSVTAPITVKYSVVSNASLSLWTERIVVAPTTYS